MAKIHITAPASSEQLKDINIGDTIILSGKIYTARDAAHKRLKQLIENGEQLPIDIKNACIYYTGPCPEKPGDVIGSCGPTTSSRMDSYAPKMLDLGQTIMVGKGLRSKDVIDAMIRNGAVYLAATGGAGALLASCVKSKKTVAFPELLSEAIYELEIENMPLICAIDAKGDSLYEQGIETYKK